MRLLTKEQDLGTAFRKHINADAATRAEFIRRSRGMLGVNMKALVKTMVAEKVSCRRVRKRSKSIRYVDIHDLRKHFKGKREQYIHVCNKGPEFTCTHTGTAMYAIHTFQQDNPHWHLAMFNQ